eukprot:CAMPEP_0179879162 /NCGR_PEP_ID=MMETSP0982-20121206/26033_1 /TAXON_ID=483367 /ORGANISM="non described non described, Strain CCMP 2436" /LENGTH=31 /DNA_ID= /DNA_START= /DNA_END= /DNA_ORIENTATION=
MADQEEAAVCTDYPPFPPAPAARRGARRGLG